MTVKNEDNLLVRNSAVLEFMQTRRSVPSKTLDGPGPNDAQLKEILSIAARVPDHGKLAPWRFVEYQSEAKIRLCDAILKRALVLTPDLNQELQKVEANRLPQNHAVVGLVSSPKEHPKVPVWEQELSAGACGMNLLIAANAIGFDAQWYTGWYAFDETLIPLFGVEKGERLAGFFHIGKKTLPKTERDRPNLDEIFTVMES